MSPIPHDAQRWLRRIHVTVLVCNFSLRCRNAVRARAVALKRRRTPQSVAEISFQVTRRNRAGVRLAWSLLRAFTPLYVAILAAGDQVANAQVVLPPTPPLESPWNAQRVFEPVPFPYRWDTDGLDDILPEDTPVKTRLHPGYEAVG